MVSLDLFETQIIDMSIMCQKAACCDMDLWPGGQRTAVCHSPGFSDVVSVFLTVL